MNTKTFEKIEDIKAINRRIKQTQKSIEAVENLNWVVLGLGAVGVVGFLCGFYEVGLFSVVGIIGMGIIATVI